VAIADVNTGRTVDCKWDIYLDRCALANDKCGNRPLIYPIKNGFATATHNSFIIEAKY
jgi:hypothetical protein